MSFKLIGCTSEMFGYQDCNSCAIAPNSDNCYEYRDDVGAVPKFLESVADTMRHKPWLSEQPAFNGESQKHKELVMKANSPQHLLKLMGKLECPDDEGATP